jgi:hypothetical protein
MKGHTHKQKRISHPSYKCYREQRQLWQALWASCENRGVRTCIAVQQHSAKHFWRTSDCSPEERGSMFLRNVGTYLQARTALQPSKPISTSLEIRLCRACVKAVCGLASHSCVRPSVYPCSGNETALAQRIKNMC